MLVLIVKMIILLKLEFSRSLTQKCGRKIIVITQTLTYFHFPTTSLYLYLQPPPTKSREFWLYVIMCNRLFPYMPNMVKIKLQLQVFQ